MTDELKVKLCAEAMGFVITGSHWGGLPLMVRQAGVYDPRNDNGQAMDLVKALNITCEWLGARWECHDPLGHDAISENLNAAIVECVAKMQESRREVA